MENLIIINRLKMTLILCEAFYFNIALVREKSMKIKD